MGNNRFNVVRSVLRQGGSNGGNFPHLARPFLFTKTHLAIQVELIPEQIPPKIEIWGLMLSMERLAGA
jgi:hypothetical protein